MAKSSFCDAHMQSIDHDIADDGKRRQSLLHSDFHSSDTDIETVLNAAMRLFCGRDRNALRVVSETPELRQATFTLLHKIPLRHVLQPAEAFYSCETD